VLLLGKIAMAKTYADVQAQIAKLQAEAEVLRKREINGVIGRIKEAIAHYGLTAEDLGLGVQRRERVVATGKQRRQPDSAKAKYSDGQGNTWGGRGPRPAWLRDALAAGRSLEAFSSSGAKAAVAAGTTTSSRRKPVVKRGSAGPKIHAKRASKAKRPTRGKRATVADASSSTQGGSAETPEAEQRAEV
jgi:DNA-binding protein H-NS